MSWLSANLPAILTVWAGLGFVAGAVGHNLPPGKVKAALTAFSAVSPLDLIGVWRNIGIAMTPPTMAPVEPPK